MITLELPGLDDIIASVLTSTTQSTAGKIEIAIRLIMSRALAAELRSLVTAIDKKTKTVDSPLIDDHRLDIVFQVIKNRADELSPLLSSQ